MGGGGPGICPCPLGLVAPVIWGRLKVVPSAVTGGQAGTVVFQSILGGDVTLRPPEAPSGSTSQERGRVRSVQIHSGGLCSSGGHSVDIKAPAQFLGHQSFCRVRVMSAEAQVGRPPCQPPGRLASVSSWGPGLPQGGSGPGPLCQVAGPQRVLHPPASWDLPDRAAAGRYRAGNPLTPSEDGDCILQ